MRIPTRERKRGLSFNITPLIDIVFLLIIFFLAASHLVRSELQEKVELPEATQAKDDDARVPRRLVLTVKADKTMLVAGKPIDLQHIEQMILSGQQSSDDREFEIRIRSDQRVPFSAIKPIMLACARAGVTKVGFAVLPK